MAGGGARRSGRAARDAAQSLDRRAPDRRISPSSCARIPSAPTTPRPTRSGSCIARCARFGSIVLKNADACQVPAGGALAVDRDGFSLGVEAAIHGHPRIRVERGEIAGLPPEDWDNVIVATGPLTSPSLAEAIGRLSGEGALAFFDAIAPIVHRHSIDMDVAWMQSRYDKEGPGGGGAEAYVNCPMTRDQYEAFIDALLAAEKTEFREFEGTPYFDGCLPIEVMAERGRETLRHGPMKPFGLTNAHDPKVKPYAVVQLRQDNALGTLFNIVGFQTKLKYGEQGRIFRMIPGLEQAEFARLGGIHRNTYLNSPRLLDAAAPAQGEPTAALRRPDHRLRGLCRERRDRPCRRALRRRRAARPRSRASAADDRDRRAPEPHHRRPHREHRRRPALVPADERQFRPVSTDRRAAVRRGRPAPQGAGARPRPQARALGPGGRGPQALDRGRSRARTTRARLGLRTARGASDKPNPNPTKPIQIRQSLGKGPQRKRLGFPWIALSESSLFKGLRQLPRRKVFSAPLSACTRG